MYSGREWNRIKHSKERKPSFEKWRKLHIAIDTSAGEILSSSYGKSTATDGPELPNLLERIDEPISAVCADMAYDTVNCREIIKQKKSRQWGKGHLWNDSEGVKSLIHETLISFLQLSHKIVWQVTDRIYLLTCLHCLRYAKRFP